jgi:hypothetical protein
MSTNTTNHRGRRVVSGLTATGSSQATAFPLLNAADHQFTTVGSSTGAVLPSARLADSVSVWNGGSNTLSVYPPSGGKVNDGSVNAAYSLGAAAGVTFFATDLGTWYAGSSAGGSGTVTSVAATVPVDLKVTGSPITTTGTLAITRVGPAVDTFQYTQYGGV